MTIRHVCIFALAWFMCPRVSFARGPTEGLTGHLLAAESVKQDGYLLATEEHGTYTLSRVDGSGKETGVRQFEFGIKDDSQATLERLIGTSDGGFLVVGSLKRPGLEGGRTLVLKLDSSNRLVWQRIYGPEQQTEESLTNNGEGPWLDRPGAALQVQGGYLVGGFNGLVKIDDRGNVVWRRIYYHRDKTQSDEAGGQTDTFSEIVDVASRGTGYWACSVNWIGAINPDGSLAWHTLFALPPGFIGQWGRCVDTTDGGVVLVVRATGDHSGKVFVAKFSPKGAVEWSQSLTGTLGSDGQTSRCYLDEVRERAADKSILVGGFEASSRVKALVAVFSKKGSPSWVKTFGGGLEKCDILSTKSLRCGGRSTGTITSFEETARPKNSKNKGPQDDDFWQNTELGWWQFGFSMTGQATSLINPGTSGCQVERAELTVVPTTSGISKALTLVSTEYAAQLNDPVLDTP